jgi:type IV secretion system protein VirD4
MQNANPNVAFGSEPYSFAKGPDIHLGWTSAPRQRMGFTSKQTQENSRISIGPEGHLVTFAPTGAGKTSRTIARALQNTTRSFIVVDPKAELHRLTGPTREAMGFKTYLIDPFSETDETFGLDPFEMFKGTIGHDELATIATWITVPSLSYRADPFWDQSARTIILGLLSFLINRLPKEFHRIPVIRQLWTDDRRQAAVLAYSSLIGSQSEKAAANVLATAADKTRASIQVTVDNAISFLDSPAIQKGLGSGTQTVNVGPDLNDGRFTVYLTIPPDKLASHGVLLKLWIGAILQRYLRDRPNGSPKSTAVVVLDEAAAIGQMAELETFYTLGRGYGLQIWTLWQDLQQMERIYPQSANTVLGNAAVVQAFGLTGGRSIASLAEALSVSPQQLTDLTCDQQFLCVRGVAHSAVNLPPIWADTSSDQYSAKTGMGDQR